MLIGADVSKEPSDPLADVEAIHSKKTGALITCAVEMGAIIGGADDDKHGYWNINPTQIEFL